MEKQKQITEAVKRMKQLNLFANIIKEFSVDQVVEYSEPTPLGGILYWVRNNPEWMDILHDFEEKYDATVYHVIHSYTAIGELLSFLYVSDTEEEWEYDWEDLRENCPFAYVYNLDYPECSEFGLIEVAERAGGLIRVA